MDCTARVTFDWQELFLIKFRNEIKNANELEIIRLKHILEEELNEEHSKDFKLAIDALVNMLNEL